MEIQHPPYPAQTNRGDPRAATEAHGIWRGYNVAISTSYFHIGVSSLSSHEKSPALSASGSRDLGGLERRMAEYERCARASRFSSCGREAKDITKRAFCRAGVEYLKFYAF